MYILTCPTCGERDDLKHLWNTFYCESCNSEHELEEMDFEYYS